jgi:hemoglobin/transferrin/lactoferrin receptor protein
VSSNKDSPWAQRPIVRGLGGHRVLVLVDGSSMNSARGHSPYPSLVDPSQVERIEVVRGPSSVAYGSDALGGVVNIITRDPRSVLAGRRFGGSATVGGGFAGLPERSGSLTLMSDWDRFSAVVAGGARKADDFRNADGTIRNSGFGSWNALAILRYELTDRLDVSSGWQTSRARRVGLPGLNLEQPGDFGRFSFRFYERDHAHLTLDHSYPDSWLAQSRIRVYWQRESRDFFSEHAVDSAQFYNDRYLGLNPFYNPAPPTATAISQEQDRYFVLHTYGAQIQMTSRRTARSVFTAGLDAARDRTTGDNQRFRTWHYASSAGLDSLGPTSLRVTASLPEGRFDNYGAYLQGEWFVHPQWTLSAGGRYTHYRYRTDRGLNTPAAGPIPAVYFEPTSVDDDALSGAVGMVYTAASDLHVTANVATGYREPNAQDLFFNGPGSVGLVIGNPDLKPERSVSYDVGLRWGPGRFAFSGNVFYSVFDDLINALPAGFGTYQYTNIASARMWGGEAEAEWVFLPQWRARAALSGTVGDITSREAVLAIYGVDTDEAPLEQVPPFGGSASLRWTDAAGRFWVEAGARYSWRTNRLPLPIPGVGQFSEFKKEWIVGDLSAGARLETGQRLVLGVRNVTDRRYRRPVASVVDPGLTVFGSVITDF